MRLNCRPSSRTPCTAVVQAMDQARQPAPDDPHSAIAESLQRRVRRGFGAPSMSLAEPNVVNFSMLRPCRQASHGPAVTPFEAVRYDCGGLTMKAAKFDLAACGCRPHGSVDELGNSVEQKVAVAAHEGIIIADRVNAKRDMFVFGDWPTQLVHFVQQRRGWNFAKCSQPA
jgi:hypothetical protein